LGLPGPAFFLRFDLADQAPLVRPEDALASQQCCGSGIIGPDPTLTWNFKKNMLSNRLYQHHKS
jgi:hypothetical protein